MAKTKEEKSIQKATKTRITGGDIFRSRFQFKLIFLFSLGFVVFVFILLCPFLMVWSDFLCAPISFSWHCHYWLEFGSPYDFFHMHPNVLLKHISVIFSTSVGLSSYGKNGHDVTVSVAGGRNQYRRRIHAPSIS